MDESEKYLFDVHGYIVIKGALSAEELSAANKAMDHHSDQISVMNNSLANSSPTLFGKTGRGNMGNMLT